VLKLHGFGSKVCVSWITKPFAAHNSGLPSVLLVYFFEPSVMNYDDADVRHMALCSESIQDLQKVKSINATIYFFHSENNVSRN
jgi:hypothetical protein